MRTKDKYRLTHTMDKIYKEEYLEKLYNEILFRVEYFLKSESDITHIEQDIKFIADTLGVKNPDIKIFDSNVELLEYFKDIKLTTEKCKKHSMLSMLEKAAGEEQKSKSTENIFLENYKHFNSLIPEKNINFVNLPFEEQIDDIQKTENTDELKFELLNLIFSSDRWIEFQRNIQNQIGTKTIDNILNKSSTGTVEIPVRFRQKLNELQHSNILNQSRYLNDNLDFEDWYIDSYVSEDENNIFTLLLYSSVEKYLVNLFSSDKIYIDTLYRLYTNVSNIFILNDNLIYAVRKPTVDYNIRLNKYIIHNEKEKAVKYPDGSGYSYTRGMRLPNWINDTPMDKEKANKILSIENVSVRDIAIEIVGRDNLLLNLDFKVIDEKDEYQLLLIKIDGFDCEFLKMKNPTTGEVHIEGILPGIDTVEKALAWRLGLQVYNEPVVKS